MTSVCTNRFQFLSKLEMNLKNVSCDQSQHFEWTRKGKEVSRLDFAESFKNLQLCRGKIQVKKTSNVKFLQFNKMLRLWIISFYCTMQIHQRSVLTRDHEMTSTFPVSIAWVAEISLKTSFAPCATSISDSCKYVCWNMWRKSTRKFCNYKIIKVWRPRNVSEMKTCEIGSNCFILRWFFRESNGRWDDSLLKVRIIKKWCHFESCVKVCVQFVIIVTSSTTKISQAIKLNQSTEEGERKVKESLAWHNYKQDANELSLLGFPIQRGILRDGVNV